MNPTGDSNVPPATDGAAPLPHVADVGAQRIARVYAEALLNAAVKRNAEDDVLEELQSLVSDVFLAQPDFESFIGSLAIGRDRKADVIRRVFGGKASLLFVNFLLILNDHDRLDLLPSVLAQCIELRERRQGLMRVLVRTAVPLPDEQRSRLIGELRQTFGKEPVLEPQVDPEVLGGLILRVGDWLYDASVRTQLNNLKTQLFESSSHEIQSGRNRFSIDAGN
jgi:F-type H+-transporting ATPase subunit delta